MRRPAPARRSTGATGTGISFGTSVFRLLHSLRALALGRHVCARELGRVVAHTHLLTGRLLGSGRGTRSFRTCVRIGLRAGFRIGLALFCLAVGLGVGIGLSVWLVGHLFVGLVILVGRLIGWAAPPPRTRFQAGARAASRPVRTVAR